MASNRQQATAVMPIKVRKINSHIPCQSCNLKRSRYKARFDPPGKARVTFRLCDRCIEAIRHECNHH